MGTTFGIRGIPALVVVDAADGTVITKEGRSDIMSKGGRAFQQWESQALGGPEDVDVSVVDMLADNPDQVKREAGEILVRLLRNVMREPSNLKFRSVKLSNPKIESKLLTANGAFEILFSVGFEEVRRGALGESKPEMEGLLMQLLTALACRMTTGWSFHSPSQWPFWRPTPMQSPRWLAWQEMHLQQLQEGQQLHQKVLLPWHRRRNPTKNPPRGPFCRYQSTSGTNPVLRTC